MQFCLPPAHQGVSGVKKMLRLFRLRKRRSRVTAIQIYGIAEAVNRTNAADTAML